MSGSSTETDADPYLDAANRLQRNLDVQIATLDGIEEKAEHVTRLLGGLTGVLLSAVSIGFQIGGTPAVATTTLAAFSTGLVAWILSMGASVVTYLNSRFKVGLGSTAGHLLCNPAFRTDAETHARRVLGTYAHSIEQNERVIEANSARFRVALVLLLVGVTYLGLAVVLFVSDGGPFDGWLGFPVAGVVATGTTWYVLSGRYLTLRGKGWT